MGRTARSPAEGVAAAGGGSESPPPADTRAEERSGGEKRAPIASVAPTLADLRVLWGGRDRLLRVAEVAEQLAVGAWRIYQLCENGELPQVRINNSIRVRPKDLEEFIASRLKVIEGRRLHRRKKPPE